MWDNNEASTGLCCPTSTDKRSLVEQDAEGASRKLTSGQICLLIMLYFLLCAENISVTIQVGFSPSFFQSKGLDLTWVGFSSATNSIVVGLMAPVAAYLGKRYPVVKLVTCAVGGSAFVDFMIGISGTTFSGLTFGVMQLVLRFLGGLFKGIDGVLVLAIVMRIVPEEKVALVIGIGESFQGLGRLLSPLMGTLIFPAGGWFGVYATSGSLLLAVFVALCIYLVSAPDLPVKQNDQEQDPWLLIKRPPVIALLIITFIVMAPMNSSEPGLQPYLMGPPFNISQTAVGLVYLFIGAMSMVSAMLTAPLVKCFGQVGLQYISLLTTLVGSLMFGFGPMTLPFVLLSATVMAVGTMPQMVSMNPLLLRVCRTYDLDPQAYTETIAAIFALVLITGSSGALAIGGVGIEAVGTLRGWILILEAFIFPVGLIALIWGFHPFIMGRPLAPAEPAASLKDHDPSSGSQKISGAILQN